MPTNLDLAPRMTRIWPLLAAALTLAAVVVTAGAVTTRRQSGTPAADPDAVPVAPAADATLG